MFSDTAIRWMPPGERRLVREVMATESGSRPDLELALARLRNLREKYQERIKRARLDARAGIASESAETLRTWLECIDAAAARARAGLDAIQDPGPVDAADIGPD